MKPYKNYKETLLQDLKNPKEALGYLRTAFDEDDKRVFLLALRDVAEAQGGLAKLAKVSHLSREHLYQMLSKNGNPELAGLRQVLNALGFQLSVEPKKLKRAA